MAVEWGAEQAAMLEQLEEEERSLSAQRRMLHDRIDGFGGGEASDAQELDLSRRRRDLHARIDALRAQRQASSTPPAA